jgi:hypothetical protein
LPLTCDESAWKRGANSLNEAPPEPTPADAANVNEAFALELNQIKALGIQALMARTLEKRAVVYGDLIRALRTLSSVRAARGADNAGTRCAALNCGIGGAGSST